MSFRMNCSFSIANKVFRILFYRSLTYTAQTCISEDTLAVSSTFGLIRLSTQENRKGIIFNSITYLKRSVVFDLNRDSKMVDTSSEFSVDNNRQSFNIRSNISFLINTVAHSLLSTTCKIMEQQEWPMGPSKSCF